MMTHFLTYPLKYKLWNDLQTIADLYQSGHGIEAKAEKKVDGFIDSFFQSDPCNDS